MVTKHATISGPNIIFQGVRTFKAIAQSPNNFEFPVSFNGTATDMAGFRPRRLFYLSYTRIYFAVWAGLMALFYACMTRHHYSQVKTEYETTLIKIDLE